jgi:hypothetical protein
LPISIRRTSKVGRPTISSSLPVTNVVTGARERFRRLVSAPRPVGGPSLDVLLWELWSNDLPTRSTEWDRGQDGQHRFARNGV